jgi:hypothetical protein
VRPTPREFWQRAEDRNRQTAAVYDALGLPEYYALEASRALARSGRQPVRTCLPVRVCLPGRVCQGEAGKDGGG